MNLMKILKVQKKLSHKKVNLNNLNPIKIYTPGRNNL